MARHRPVKATIGGSTPPAGARIQRINILSKYSLRKGKPIGDGTRLEIGRAMSLGGSTPSPSAPLGNRLTGRLPDFESGRGGSNPPSRIDDSGAVAAGSDATL